MPGGPISFRRIVDNLLLNAAQGDGATHAHNLLVKVALEDGRYHLQLLDDGPGFSPEMLTAKRQRFNSKPRGSGLGLLTMDALVRAAGGVLVLANRQEGGARVDVFLPLPGPSAQPSQDASA